MKPRTPQLPLSLDAAVELPWRPGGRIPYLGGWLTLVPDATRRAVQCTNGELHLSLPVAASAQQIRDAAESWLRRQALELFRQIVAEKSARAGRHPPPVTLGFGKMSDWVRLEAGRLRCHWRLIEQPRGVIEQVLELAVFEMPQPRTTADLFACA